MVRSNFPLNRGNFFLTKVPTSSLLRSTRTSENITVFHLFKSYFIFYFSYFRTVFLWARLDFFEGYLFLLCQTRYFLCYYHSPILSFYFIYIYSGITVFIYYTYLFIYLYLPLLKRNSLVSLLTSSLLPLSFSGNLMLSFFTTSVLGDYIWL